MDSESLVRNTLLSSLSPQTFSRIRPYLQAVELPVRHVLASPDRVTTHVYFLESGLGSIIAPAGREQSIEVAHVGREGMSAPHVLLHVDRSPNHTFMQAGGHGFSLPVEVLHDALDNDPDMRVRFLRYVYYYEQQLVQSALANGLYNLHQRLARWLLMCHDRLDTNELPITHDFLALMLGVRRSGVTDNLHILEGAHAISSTRGQVRILSRAKLEEIAGECYGPAEREYERVLRMPLRGQDLPHGDYRPPRVKAG